MKDEFPGQIFEKYSNVKFHENPYSGEPSCSVQTDGGLDGQKDMRKLIVAFRNFANALNKKTFYQIVMFLLLTCSK